MHVQLKRRIKDMYEDPNKIIMAYLPTLHSTVIVVFIFIGFGMTNVSAQEPICDEDKCDWEVQYCCGNNTCCNWECDNGCVNKTFFCCQNNTCCQYECDGGCNGADQFCCGRKPNVCCSTGSWHAKWWTWLLVSVFVILLISATAFVCRSQFRKPRSPTYRSSDPYESGDEKGLEASLHHVPPADQRNPYNYQTLK
ncbi:uncharacterized protein [Amphiura filiformis]|uniref:uncharacterized protein n=1 Tax=Amphiura filiformis TaxID=82378 RepID=UPI003B2179CA